MRKFWTRKFLTIKYLLFILDHVADFNPSSAWTSEYSSRASSVFTKPPSMTRKCIPKSYMSTAQRSTMIISPTMSMSGQQSQSVDHMMTNVNSPAPSASPSQVYAGTAYPISSFSSLLKNFMSSSSFSADQYSTAYDNAGNTHAGSISQNMYSPVVHSAGQASSVYSPSDANYGSSITNFGSPSSNYGSPSANYGSPSAYYGSSSASHGSSGASQMYSPTMSSMYSQGQIIGESSAAYFQSSYQGSSAGGTTSSIPVQASSINVGNMNSGSSSVGSSLGQTQFSSVYSQGGGNQYSMSSQTISSAFSEGGVTSEALSSVSSAYYASSYYGTGGITSSIPVGSSSANLENMHSASLQHSSSSVQNSMGQMASPSQSNIGSAIHYQSTNYEAFIQSSVSQGQSSYQESSAGGFASSIPVQASSVNVGNMHSESSIGQNQFSSVYSQGGGNQMSAIYSPGGQMGSTFSIGQMSSVGPGSETLKLSNSPAQTPGIYSSFSNVQASAFASAIDVSTSSLPHVFSSASPMDCAEQPIKEDGPCTVDSCLVQNSEDVTMFRYKNCISPYVTELKGSDSNTRRRLKNTITLKGGNFAANPSDNLVKFQNYRCDVVSVAADSLDCKIAESLEPTMNTWLPLTLHVNNIGNGLVKINTEQQKSVIFQLTLENVSPQIGSFAGETKLRLKGTGFQSDTVSVCVGKAPCPIYSKKYDEIVCYTPPCVNCNVSTKATVTVYDSSYQHFTTCASQWNGGQPYFTFDYIDTITPEIFAIEPRTVESANVTLNITGDKFGVNMSNIVVTVGRYKCNVFMLNNTNISCVMPAMEAGSYEVGVLSVLYGKALAKSAMLVESKALVKNLSPTKGSIHGGTRVTIKGHGFHIDSTVVKFGSKVAVVQSVTPDEVICITPANTQLNHVHLQFKVISIVAGQFNFDSSASPDVSSISPINGVGGNTLTLTGTFQSTTVSDVSVTIGSDSCPVVSVTSTEVTCTLPNHPAGSEVVKVNIKGYGLSNNKNFLFDLTTSGVQPAASGFGGHRLLTLTGRGYGNDTNVTVCSFPCKILSENTTDNTILCWSPRYVNYTSSLPDQSCDVVISQRSEKVTLTGAYSYQQALTSTITSVTPKRGGTGGGVRTTIVGTNFPTNLNDAKVSIAGVACEVKSVNATAVVCVTAPRTGVAMNVDVELIFANRGAAYPIDADFSYIDVWSSIYSWGGTYLPKKGKLVCLWLNIACVCVGGLLVLGDEIGE